MTLREHQSLFVKDVCLLIQYATKIGLDMSFGEVWRTKEQQAIYLQDGLSKTKNSMHLKRLAIDINFFINGKYIEEFIDTKQERETRANTYLQLAKYWESLNPINKAGARWGWDCNHFERQVI